MKPIDPLPGLLQEFFCRYMLEQRNLSAHTVRSYRDTWRLFLRYSAKRHDRAVAKLVFGDLTAAMVGAFLQQCEQERKVTVGTRNCRLAALHAFFSFVAEREPAYAAQCNAVLRIPTKRAAVHAPCYLDPDEVDAIILQPDRTVLEGQRDHALLCFLYNTGARIQEALDVCPQSIRFDPPSYVRLIGKGRKSRICPLWPETVAIIKALLKRQPCADSEPIFVNRYGAPLGASGVRCKLAQYVQAAAKTVPTLSSKHVSPHSFRHAAAVHLVAAGVDVTVIRSWLGHVSLDTTNHYAQANLATKRAALERLEPASKIDRPPRWKRDADLLAWLDSL
ncbi:Tyrosine recombinase XerD [Paraburkholderia phenoliruptrix]|uniref:Tyrosine recombinase XerD n=1 Tax=Paraburkholderia phenoliruptrix TaxID=252970 RepID=A0A6J5CGM0_9BURK|nr:tyrosine-type recombinase/integrase [Paraburkholderia phenoliruptrix]CAB3734604.1 Tyrosine recombinase XerD [Paraburkholderia phenoliruptrix]